jgi:phosphate transport system permease protein
MVRHSEITDEIIKQEVERAFKSKRLKRRIVDTIAVYLLAFCAVLVIAALFNILLHLMIKGFSSINLEFLTQLPKPVGETGGGMGNAILGTLTLLGIAIVVGVPIGLGAGIYLSEYAHARFANIVRFTTDVMNGIPSIVYGIFVYTIMVLPLKSFSAFSGGVALGIMMIPMITRTSEQFVRMVPPSLREAGLALGVPKWKVTLDIILPVSIGGIMTGIMSALARVAGETAPLLFTAFGNHFWQSSLMQPIAALPLQIFAYAISPYDDWHAKAWAGALVLISLVFLINVLSNYFVNRQKRIFSGT